jgi:cytochrome P450
MPSKPSRSARTNGATADLRQALIDARSRDSGDSGGDRFSREELLDQVCFLFLAGHETSASSLGMAVYLLSCYPEAQACLRAEVME